MFDPDDFTYYTDDFTDHNDNPVSRYTFRCAGWDAAYGPCGDPDCSRCGPSVAAPADEDEDEDADGEE